MPTAQPVVSGLRAAARLALPRRVANRLKFSLMLRREERAGEPELADLLSLVPPGSVAVDVGANAGMVTWLLSRRAGRVVAVEPNPALAAKLRRDFAGEAVEVAECALSDAAGEGTLLVPSADGVELDGRASLEADANGGLDVRPVEVPVRTLDGLGLRDVGFVKIDVEGHEMSVLRGAERLLAEQAPSLLVEAEEKFGEGLAAAVVGHLRDRGYDGVFLWEGAYRDAAGFEPALHQPPELAKRPGEPADPRYVRNLLFVHRSRRPMLDAMTSSRGR